MSAEPLSLPGMEGKVNAYDESRLKSDEARRLFEAQYGDAAWMDDYFDLLAEGWTWRQAFYIIWASIPKKSRQPKTQYQLATEVLGLESDRVIRAWKEKNPALQMRIDALTRQTLGKARADIYDALIAAASDPNPRAHQDRKLALELMGDYTPKQSVAISAENADVEELSPEELQSSALIPGVQGDAE